MISWIEIKHRRIYLQTWNEPERQTSTIVTPSIHASQQEVNLLKVRRTSFPSLWSVFSYIAANNASRSASLERFETASPLASPAIEHAFTDRNGKSFADRMRLNLVREDKRFAGSPLRWNILAQDRLFTVIVGSSIYSNFTRA